MKAFNDDGSVTSAVDADVVEAPVAVAALVIVTVAVSELHHGLVSRRF